MNSKDNIMHSFPYSRLFGACLALLLSQEVNAADISSTMLSQPEAQSLMIYQAAVPNQSLRMPQPEQGFATISQRYRCSLPEGTHLLQLGDLPETLQESSLMVRSNSLSFRKQIYRHAVNESPLHSAAMLNIPVTVRFQAGSQQETLEGKLLSPNEPLILQDKGGQVHQIPSYLQLSFAPNVSALLPKAYSLQWEVSAAKPANHLIDLHYQSGGISWTPSYQLVLTASEDAMKTPAELNGWATITNQTRSHFSNIETTLIAGHVKHSTPRRAPMMLKSQHAMVEADVPIQESFVPDSGYYRYPLSQPLTLEAYQTVKIPLFMASKAINVFHKYRYKASESPAVAHFIEFVNEREASLGIPLPAGKIQVYRQQDQAVFFIGEDHIPHTPSGERVSLNIGDAFDIKAKRIVLQHKERTAERKASEEVEVSLHNASSQKMTVQVQEILGRSLDWSIKSESSHKKLEANLAEFVVDIPANQTTSLRYLVEYRW